MDKFELPLFPLSTVLYPDFPLSLVIFEPRYLKMIRGCLDQQSPFGVVLIKKGREVGEVAEPYRIGTMAKIVQALPQDDGTIYIMVEGQERFKIWQYRVTDDNYLLGTVSKLDEPAGEDDDILAIVETIQPLLQTYLSLMADQQADPIPDTTILDYDEPARLSYQIAAMLTIAPVEKQTLLEIDSPIGRLERMIKILGREIELWQLNGPETTHKLPWGDEIHLN